MAERHGGGSTKSAVQRLDVKGGSEMRIVIAISIGALAGLSALAQSAGPPVLTGENDNFRTGANLNEPVLGVPGNISVATFGKVGSLPVDGNVYAQPLYVPGVTIN